MDPLEQMKEQLALLRCKLERQEIISDRLIRSIVHQKVQALNREALVLGVVAVLSIPYCTWVFYMLGTSLWFSLITAAFLAVAASYTWYSHRGLDRRSLAVSSLREVGQRIARMKMLYARWLCFSLPFVCLWLAWFAFEITGQADLSVERRVGILCGGAVGGIVGGIAGWMSYNRTQRLAREILDQVANLETA